ncbi:sigma-70 family RNA polymerase sigma factor [Chitinophaga sp. MM2321]|uniref:RNA polymerase sigma factor n=1 Tax=Chitinophaga sp. MM2321 TaxID=3137178 RepID=UPI0032D5868E
MHANQLPMTIHPDQRYLDGLLNNDTRLVQEIYERFAGKIRHHIMQHQGSEDDAADIFQESIMDLYNQAKHKELQLTCPFEPFFLLICKRKWLNELKKRGRQPVTKRLDDLYEVGEDVFASAEQVIKEEAEASMFLAQFERLGEKCKEILRQALAGEAQEKIAAAMGVTYGYLRKKKSECMATLLSYVQAQKI